MACKFLLFVGLQLLFNRIGVANFAKKTLKLAIRKQGQLVFRPSIGTCKLPKHFRGARGPVRCLFKIEKPMQHAALGTDRWRTHTYHEVESTCSLDRVIETRLKIRRHQKDNLSTRMEFRQFWQHVCC